MDRRELDRFRFSTLYTSRDEPRHIAFAAARPLPNIPKTSSRTSRPYVSPKLSNASTASTSRRESVSSRESVETKATSVSSTPPLPMARTNDYGYELPCEFLFSGCGLRFHPDDLELWIAHSRSHFLEFGPPDYAICIFCDEDEGRFRSRGNPVSNWRDRMLHIRGHFQNQDSWMSMRPDFDLIEYMNYIRNISRNDYESAMKHSERPDCDGIVPRDFKTNEMVSKEMRRERESRIHIDDRKERRERGRGERDGKKSRHTHIAHRPILFNDHHQ